MSDNQDKPVPTTDEWNAMNEDDQLDAMENSIMDMLGGLKDENGNSITGIVFDYGDGEVRDIKGNLIDEDN